MKKVLLVTYTPRLKSKTREIVNLAKSMLSELPCEVEEVDLVKNPPDLFLEESLNAYYKRNFYNLELDEAEKKSLSGMDKLASQLEQADLLILAYPIYNYSLPAAVKAWVDAVAQRGRAFEDTDYGPQGHYQDKKTLIINVSNGTQKDSKRDFSSPLVVNVMNLMGITQIDFVGVFGAKFFTDLSEKLPVLRSELKQVFEKWFNNF